MITASADEVDDAVAAARKSPKNQKVNRRAAEALLEAGRGPEAVEYFLKSDNRGNLDAARILVGEYQYERAGELLDRYVAKRTKEQAANDRNFIVSWSDEPLDETDVLSAQILLGRSMIDRVEKIQIIDSVNVSADDFFKYYKLASTAGSVQADEWVERILPRNWLAANELESLSSMAYVSEDGRYVVFSASDEDGNTAMYEMNRLSDGTWDTPHKIFDHESIFGSGKGTVVEYPFLMSDGISMYFAADGEESLGGLDIFVSRRDEDSYLQPSNIGMPYNSPANDYLYAIDEVTGTGWWATDRNGLEDSVTIYTFIPQNDLRINYPADTPELASLAKVKSIADTWVDGKDYSRLKARIAAIKPGTSRSQESEFEFSLPSGKVLTSLSEFEKPAARKAMERLIAAQGVLQANLRQLEELRERYGKGETTLSFRILSLEEKVEESAAELRDLSNEVVKLETAR
ncbi:MAG: hypothetical protein NC098_02665 [Lachnoclostridium sp.]|nr:hypothetical protein [Lachnoclostridium sp.]